VRVSGAFGRSEELLQALRQSLKVDVATFDPLERIDLGALPEAVRAEIEPRGPELALAVGLALATEHVHALDLDLTPKPILARRAFLTRTAFLYAAGALLALGLAISLVTALVARSNARSRHSDLARIQGALESRRDALNEKAEGNRRAIQVVNALARRTQGGGAALRLLARLREATPGRVTISEVALEAPAPARPGLASEPVATEKGEVLFKLRGQVDNAAGDGIQVLGRFEAALREDPAVASAKVTGTPVAQAGAILDFVMTVAMRAQARGPEE
jgi:hypothetical protein